MWRTCQVGNVLSHNKWEQKQTKKERVNGSLSTFCSHLDLFSYEMLDSGCGKPLKAAMCTPANPPKAMQLSRHLNPPHVSCRLCCQTPNTFPPVSLSRIVFRVLMYKNSSSASWEVLDYLLVTLLKVSSCVHVVIHLLCNI